jgi:hypothetical protein
MPYVPASVRIKLAQVRARTLIVVKALEVALALLLTLRGERSHLCLAIRGCLGHPRVPICLYIARQDDRTDRNRDRTMQAQNHA